MSCYSALRRHSVGASSRLGRSLVRAVTAARILLRAPRLLVPRASVLICGSWFSPSMLRRCSQVVSSDHSIERTAIDIQDGGCAQHVAAGCGQQVADVALLDLLERQILSKQLRDGIRSACATAWTIEDLVGY